MFVILTYDVKTKRVGKVRKAAKRYLRPVQRSVFEGFLSEGRLSHMKEELFSRIDTQEDSIRIYKFLNLQSAEVEELGPCSPADTIVL